MYLCRFASIYAAGLLCLALPAMAEEGPAAEPTSAALKQQLLTDEKIANLCRASIANRYDMVDAEDSSGTIRRIPRCVADYEAMRQVAEGYLKKEESAKGEIANAITSCTKDPNQAVCLDAGKALASKAAEMHEALSQKASLAIEHLSAGAGAP